MDRSVQWLGWGSLDAEERNEEMQVCFGEMYCEESSEERDLCLMIEKKRER